MLPPLTDRQRELFDYVAGRIADTGRVPTIRDVMREFGIKSPQGVVYHLTLIAQKGYLDYGRDGTSRNLGVPGLAEHLAPVAREYLTRFAPEVEVTP